ncbi:MAG: hypothetical protein EOO17_02670 [Chloroflexi bacterium]|nr:MAG: hypothetical protein EOO17_02670 [Chloroflexota bacterium]
MSNYEPKEGVDYLVDLYAAVGIDRSAASDEVNSSIKARLLEYHPDRLQGLAPEFRSKGERMAVLLNRAKLVLLDETSRGEYDTILSEWGGPISSDGTPIIKLTDHLREEAASKSPEELEAAFQAQSVEVAKMAKYNPSQQALLAKMIEQAGDDEDTKGLRDMYDATLFAEDQVLAIEEANRGELLGLTHNPRYEVSEGHANSVQLALESASNQQLAEIQHRALGGVSARLELLAGEPRHATEKVELQPISVSLPLYYEEQAQKVVELANKREALLEKRLEIFEPIYPVLELQQEAQPYIAIGIEYENNPIWLGFVFDAELFTANSIDIDEEILGHLRNGEFGIAYGAGYNILTFAPKDQIDTKTLLNTALSKFIDRFHPELAKD